MASAAAGVLRMTADDRKLQILRVAMSLFAKQGFRGTATKVIALASGVSEAMVFRHTHQKNFTPDLDSQGLLGRHLNLKTWWLRRCLRKTIRCV